MSGAEAPPYFGCTPADEQLGFSMPTGTCSDSCGGLTLTPGGDCWCDDSCTGFGDCCIDAGFFCPESSTCAGACGEISHTPGATCYCDAVCESFNDCCDDFVDTCSVPLSGTCYDGCGGKSMTAGATCYCDQWCQYYGDCCSDATSCPANTLQTSRGEGHRALGDRGALERKSRNASVSKVERHSER